jgi:type II secretory pathway component PulF
VRELIGQIAADVETGTPLSEALRRHPRHFDDLYCDLVEAGEQSGALETIYDRIAIYREKNEALKSKIKKAMFYPSMVILVAIVVTSILLLFVIPQFEDIFKSFGAELPAFTRFVIAISRFMQEWWYAIFGGAALAVFLYVRAWRKSQKVRDNTDKFILTIPVVGKYCTRRPWPVLPAPSPPPSPPVSRWWMPWSRRPEHPATMSIALRPWPFATRWWPACRSTSPCAPWIFSPTW